MTGILIKCFLALGAFYVFLRWFEQQSVFQPARGPVGLPPMRIGATREIRFESDDGVKLHGWFFKPNSDGLWHSKIILACHGNAGHLGHRADVFNSLGSLGIGVFAFDYRGYGESGGRPSEAGAYRDVEAAYRWLLNQGYAARDVVVMGESLGGGVASWLASTHEVGGLILQSTFTSVPDVGAELYPWLPVRSIGAIRFATLERLPRVHAPVLVLHSKQDEVIPFRHGEKLFAAAREPKMFWELHAGHNNLLEVDAANYRKGLITFLEKYFDIQKEIDPAKL